MGFKNRHRGETAILVANGPSLSKTPLEFLYDFPTFACNYISLLDDFIPTYLTIADGEAVGDWPDPENKLDGELVPDPERIALIEPTARMAENFFVIGEAAEPFKDYNNLRVLNRTNAAVFSYSPIRCVFTGGTSTFVNLQLAHYMGFTHVLLVGLDHDYPQTENKHFHENYLTSGRVETQDEVDRVLTVMEQSYIMAARAYAVADRYLMNVSLYSKCQIFNRGRPPWLLTGEYNREQLGLQSYTGESSVDWQLGGHTNAGMAIK